MLRIADKTSRAEKTGFITLLSAFLCCFVTPSLAPLPLLFFLLLCFVAPFFPRTSFFLPVISRAQAGVDGVVLTFDDGPSLSSTPALLELLALHKLPATFFVIGKNATDYPELIEQILAAGHSIGNHSWEHDYFLMLRSEKRLHEDIRKTQEVLKKRGAHPLVFRPPVGITGPRLKKVLERENLITVNYSCRALDRGNRNIAHLGEKIIAKLRPGDIIMLHDLPAYKQDQTENLYKEFDRMFGMLAKIHTVIPLEKAIMRPVMHLEKESATPRTAC
jgi:peptidoglycan/xylan/chitin deacetylase (PgdA/CDA1 family)